MIASYSVEFARLYGINAAIIVHKIAYLQEHTTRSDGYCWRSTDEMWQDTGLTPKMQRNAIKVLADNGFLQVKQTMIIGTAIKCRHFKLTSEYLERWNEPSEDAQTAQSVLPKGNDRTCPKVTTEDAQREQSVNNSRPNNQPNSIKENAKRKPPEVNEELFAQFWKAYPKKVGKETARRAFARLKPKQEDINLWIGAIEYQKGTRQWRDPQYIPYPATWLNGKRWQDAPEGSAPAIQYEHEIDDLAFFK